MTRPKEQPPRPNSIEDVSGPSPAPGPPAAEVPADVELMIGASVRGDVDAFGGLYQIYADHVYRYFFYRVRRDTEAQDLTAQVFLNAWKAIGRYRQENIPFLVWLYAIARNLLINYHKSNRYNLGHASLGEGVAEHVADQTDSADPIRNMLKRAENEELVRAFEQLNDEQQQVIYYRFVENWNHAEVARLMKKSEGAVRAIQFRALESLRRILGANTGEVKFG